MKKKSAPGGLGGPATKIKPVVVKHVLTQNYLQKPEQFHMRPNKQYSDANLTPGKSAGSTSALGRGYNQYGGPPGQAA